MSFLAWTKKALTQIEMLLEKRKRKNHNFRKEPKLYNIGKSKCKYAIRYILVDLLWPVVDKWIFCVGASLSPLSH